MEAQDEDSATTTGEARKKQLSSLKLNPYQFIFMNFCHRDRQLRFVPRFPQPFKQLRALHIFDVIYKHNAHTHSELLMNDSKATGRTFFGRQERYSNQKPR